MADEVIDLTNDSPPSSPPRPPRPNKSFRTTRSVLRFTASISCNKIQFKIKKLSSSPSWCTHNNIPTSIHNQPRDPSLETIEFSQINISDLQAISHGDQAQAQVQAQPQSQFAVYEPHVAFLLSHQGPKLKEPWTAEEHEQFLTGLVKYGKGRWSKIARYFVRSKTAKEVQSYATSFFKYITAMCLHSLRKKNSSSIITFKTFEEFMVNSSGYASASEEINTTEPPQTLTLFPDGGEGSSSTSMNDNVATSRGDEVDLELRLG